MKNLNLLKKMVCYRQSKEKDIYNENNSIKFETESIKSSLCDYSDVFILVVGDIGVTADNNTDFAFKNCGPFFTCKTEINVVFIAEANPIYIAMSMYNLIEYSDNYSDTSGGLLQFKRDGFRAANIDLTIDNSQSFK